MQKVHQQLISTGGNFITVLLKSARVIFSSAKKKCRAARLGDSMS